MAVGLPIIGTFESGAGTLVNDGVEGFVVPARRVDLLAQAMIAAVKDPSKNQQMGQAAYLRGGQSNSWKDYGDRLLAEYTKWLS